MLVIFLTRYEEPDKEFIKKYPRTIQESVRPKDKHRKLKNEALKQRKLQEKEMKKQEIERLKALKYKEIQAKLEKIKEVSGNDDIDFGVKFLSCTLIKCHILCVLTRVFL